MDGRRLHRTVRVLPGSRRWFISPLVEAGAEFLGAGADTAASIASVAAPAITGAGVGALTAGVTGGKPLYGALIGGGIGGIAGATGAAGSLGNYLGLTDVGNSIASGLGISPDLLDANGNVITPPIPPTGGDGNTLVMDRSAAANVGAGEGVAGGASTAAAPTAAISAARAAGGGGGGLLDGGINKTSLLLGALAGIGSILGGKPQQGTWPTPGPSSTAANNGPTWNAPLNTNVPGRTALQPVSDWYTYGQRPEQKFFSGNSLANYGWAAPVAAARGGALGEFNTGSGEHFVRGPGTGTSDSVPARLSDGEYVLTAADVNRVGGGSNERGAAILDRDRGALARTLGEKKFVRDRLKRAA